MLQFKVSHYPPLPSMARSANLAPTAGIAASWGGHGAEMSVCGSDAIEAVVDVVELAIQHALEHKPAINQRWKLYAAAPRAV
jgi:hypothetical protein